MLLNKSCSSAYYIAESKGYMKSVILTMLWLWVYIVPLFAQQEKIEVMGKVTDIKSAPLLGVSITVKDQAGLGVTTDAEGNYKMKVNRYQTLVFSSVGYEKKEVLVKDKLTINVMLQESESNALEEVTITALGPQKKVTVTGAVTTVDVSTLKTPSSSITNALAGNVAGIMAMQSSGQPGSNASEFWIRGISTFGAGTSALVLVDGFERSLNEINIEDIESFSVLKDASTTAIYGSRGANGVVLITTKRGKSGKVSINGKVEGTYNTRTYTPKFADGLTYASLMNEARTTRNQAPFYTESDLSLIREGLDQDIYPNIDWMKLLLKDGAYTKRASLNLDGGGTTARYFVSGSYIDEGGMYSTKDAWEGYDTNANYKRWNYRTNVDMDITKSTLLRIGVSGSLDKQNLPGATYNEIWNSLMGQNPISVPLRYSNGNMSSRGSGGKNNPWVLMTQMGYIENWNNKIQTNATLEQNFDFLTKGMKFIGRFGFDTNNKNYIRRVKWPTGYQAERNRGNAGEVIFKEVVAEQLLKQESSANGDRSEFLQAELHYNRDFKDHKLGAVIQYSQDKQVNTSSYGTDIMQGIERRNQRLAGRFTYGYQYRYFVDFNFGYNGSENFAKGHQFDLFPAVSGAWNVAEETFIKKNLMWVNIFKIRYSYGKVGNDYMEKNGKRIRFPYLATFTNDENTTNGFNWGDIESNNSYKGLTYNQVSSNSVTWEVATKHDLGLDFSFLNDKIGGTFDLFHEQRDGIYLQRDYVPGIIGISGSAPSANVGSSVSKGFDGSMKFTQRFGEASITLRGNLTYSKNKVLEADEQYSNYPYTTKAGFRVRQNRGLMALGLFKDYEDIRNSPTQMYGQVMPGDVKYRDINGDGKIDDNDIVPIGSTPYPNLIYGFGLSAMWKNFDFSVLFQGAGNSSFFINGFTIYPFSQGDWGNILSDVPESNRWILGENEDVNAVYPRLSYGSDVGASNNFRASSYWLRNSTYLRIKNMDVGYTLPKTFVNRYHINNCRFYFMGTNLLTFTNFKLWDPEMNSSNGQQYPLSKTFTVGMTLTL